MVLPARLFTLAVLCTALSGCGLLKMVPPTPPQQATEPPPPAPEPVATTVEPVDASIEADILFPPPVALTRKNPAGFPPNGMNSPALATTAPSRHGIPGSTPAPARPANLPGCVVKSGSTGTHPTRTGCNG